MSPERKASSSGSSGGSGTRRPPGAPGAKTTAQKPGSKRGKKRASLPRRLLKWAALGLLAFLLLAGTAFAIGYASTDIPDPNEDFTAQTTFVYYADGHNVIGRFASQNRTSVPLSDVPRHVQDAVIAAEDRTFYTNKGIDPKGIVRAAFSNAQGNSTQGASTITQQYVKVFYLSQERTFTRKVKEAFVSLKLQRQTSKDEILQGYLNTIYFGRGAYGIQAAAQAYFDKDAKDLNVAEGAVLASVLNSPTALDPAGGADNRQRLLGRYQYVLNGMASAGDITAAKAERLEPEAAEVPEDREGQPVRRPEGPHAGAGAQAAAREGLHRGADLPRWAEGEDDVHPERDARGQAGRAGPEAQGPQAAARRRRHRGPADRCAARACTAARTTSRARSTGRPPAARRGRRSSRSRSRPVSRTATRSRAPSRATRPTPSRTVSARSSTKGLATATTTARASP